MAYYLLKVAKKGQGASDLPEKMMIEASSLTAAQEKADDTAETSGGPIAGVELFTDRGLVVGEARLSRVPRVREATKDAEAPPQERSRSVARRVSLCILPAGRLSDGFAELLGGPPGARQAARVGSEAVSVNRPWPQLWVRVVLDRSRLRGEGLSMSGDRPCA